MLQHKKIVFLVKTYNTYITHNPHLFIYLFKEIVVGVYDFSLPIFQKLEKLFSKLTY